MLGGSVSVILVNLFSPSNHFQVNIPWKIRKKTGPISCSIQKSAYNTNTSIPTPPPTNTKNNNNNNYKNDDDVDTKLLHLVFGIFLFFLGWIFFLIRGQC